MKQYEPYFYSTRDRDTHHAASAILDVVLPMLPRAASAADVGCGVGAWLGKVNAEDLRYGLSLAKRAFLHNYFGKPF